MTAPLKPCPFCGSDVHIDENDAQTVATINCAKGSSCIGSGLLMGFTAKNMASAVSQWNIRADAPELVALVDAASKVTSRCRVLAEHDQIGKWNEVAELDAALAAWEALK